MGVVLLRDREWREWRANAAKGASKRKK